MKHVSYTPCFIEGEDFPTHIVTFIGTGEMRNYIPELTCEYVGDDISGGCSECRGWLDPACAYCPSCGAKVVEE